MSDMARIPLELGLRADANWLHDARRTTGINNRQTGPQQDKRNCKGTSSVSTRHCQQAIQSPSPVFLFAVGVSKPVIICPRLFQLRP
jgi:hypothetical protein